MFSAIRSSAITDFRALVDSKSSTVKRCLFGVPNCVEVREELIKQRAIMAQEEREKYNFDFVTGQPVPNIDGKNRYEWEVVQAAGVTPSAAAQNNEIVVPSPTVSPVHSNVLTAVTTGSNSFVNTKKPKKPRKSKMNKSKSLQTHIPDYYSHRKRRGSTRSKRHN